MKRYQLEHTCAVEHDASMMETHSGAVRHVHRWMPSEAPIWSTLTIIHGLGDHGGRFRRIAFSLASAGIGVLAVDLLGHGQSPGRRGVIPSYDTLMDEVGDAVALTQSTWNAPSSFVFGHSMGGNLVLNWTLRRPFETRGVSGVIAVAPMLRMAKSPSPQFLMVGRWLEQRWPNLRISAPVDVRQLCRDPDGQDAYLRDPLVHRKLSLRLGNALMESGEWALENADGFDRPCLLMHGTDDTLTCPDATQEMAQRIGKLASLKLWANCRHDLHFELQRESVTAYMVHWMKERSEVNLARSSRSVPLAA